MLFDTNSNSIGIWSGMHDDLTIVVVVVVDRGSLSVVDVSRMKEWKEPELNFQRRPKYEPKQAVVLNAITDLSDSPERW
jgi:hypothetical protein